jgi:hypothetical protein
MKPEKQEGSKPSHELFHVEHVSKEERIWHKVGAMWPTKDGGYTLDISPFDISGKIAARPRELLEKMREERKNKPAGGEPGLAPGRE